MITIKIEDLGFSDYKIRSDTNILGKQYDSNAESIFVEKPETEADSVCTMVVSYGNKIIDQIVVSDEQIWITSAISQFDHVKIQFVFQNLAEEYEKKSESKLFDFLPAKKPTDFVAETSTQQTTYASIVTKSFVDCESESGTLTFKNLSGEVVDEVDVVSTADFEALQQQVKTNTENISANSDVISDETEARTTADTTLQSNIDKKVSKYVTSNNIETTIDNGEMASEILLDALDNNKEKEGTVTVGGDQIALQVFDIGSATYPASVVLSDSGVNIAGDVYVNNEKVATQTQLNTEISDRQDADATLQTNIDNETSTRATADSTLQTNIDNLELASGASLALSIDNSTYVMTLKLLNSEGTVLSTGTVDLPLETMVVSASYSDGMLYLTLQNGTTLEGIDISAIVGGLVSQSDFDDLSTQVEMNTGNIASNATNISMNTANIATNTADISTNASAIATETTERKSADATLQSNIDSEVTARTTADTTLQEQINSNDDDISALQTADTTLQGNIDAEATSRANAVTDLQSQITTNTTNIATNTSDISDLKTQVETNKTNIESLTQGVDLAALQTQLDTNTSDIATNATAISTETTNRENADETLQTNIDNLKLESGTTLSLSIDESTYVMTVQLKNSAGTTLSTGTVDLPLETMVVSASYSDGKLYLTLKNGTQLDAIDISDIISGLVSQDDIDALKTELETSVVHTTGDEEIGGEKKFTTEVVKEHAKGYSGFAVRNTGYTMGTQPDSTIGLGRYIFLDSEGNWFAYLQSTTQASHTNLTLSCRLTTDSTTRATVELRDDGSSPKIFACGALSPTSTSKYDLGSSSYKWKDLYLSNSILLNGGTITYDASTDTFTI